MANILYPTKDALNSFFAAWSSDNGKSIAAKGYVAPTVFIYNNKTQTSWNYYNSLSEAFQKLKYIFSQPVNNVSPAGSVPFKKDGTSQTFGINVDFYFAVSPNNLVNMSYAAAKVAYNLPDKYYGVVRFYKTDGTGPFYSVFDPSVFNIAATAVGSYNSDKIAALDKFHRECALLKVKYNSLSIFLNTLASKNMNAVEQRIYSEGLSKLNAMESEMNTIKGIEFYKSKDGQIGFIQIPIIAWIVIGSIAAAWAVNNILTEYNKTARINAAYDVQKWVSEQQLKISQEVKAGSITKEQGDNLFKNLGQIAAGAIKNAEQASKPSGGLLSNIGDIVKWAAIGMGIVLIAGVASKSKS